MPKTASVAANCNDAPGQPNREATFKLLEDVLLMQCYPLRSRGLPKTASVAANCDDAPGQPNWDTMKLLEDVLKLLEGALMS